MNWGVNYVIVGNRDVACFRESATLLRKFKPDIPIVVYCDIPDFNPQIPNVECITYVRLAHPIREENRNSSLFRLIALRDSPFDVSLYLDNDINIVHQGFFDGFRIAQHYGICMTVNGRKFIKTQEGTVGDLDIGADVSDSDRQVLSDMPNYMTSYNMGVMFYNKHNHDDRFFLDKLIEEQKSNPSRGQANLYRTIWKHKIFPYALPEEWLVCEGDNPKVPLALHVGHGAIRNMFNRDYSHLLGKTI